MELETEVMRRFAKTSQSFADSVAVSSPEAEAEAVTM